MSTSEFRLAATSVLIASWLAVLGTSASNASGLAGGTIGTVANGSSQSVADGSVESLAPDAAASGATGDTSLPDGTARGAGSATTGTASSGHR